MRYPLILTLCLLCSGCGVVDAISKWFDGSPDCDTDNGGCGAHATCQQQGETVFCACVPDYRGDGKSCQPGPAEPAVALTSRGNFTCALDSAGTLRCWGDLFNVNSDGPIHAIHPTPTRVGEEQEWLSFSSYGQLLCGVRRTGALSCRDGFDGEPIPMAQTDAPASESQKFVSVSVGPYTACAINVAGELRCWTRYRNDPPVQVPSLAPWSSIASGSADNRNAVCAIKNDNTLWCWIPRTFRAPNDPQPSETPVEVDPSRHWSSLSTGDGLPCAIDERGTLFCLGYDPTSGQPRVEQQSEAVGWTRVASGNGHLCALRKDGTVWCRGSNSRGQAGGDLSDAQLDTFAQVKSDRSFEFVSVGESHSCASTATGEVWCWGDNRHGQLGDGFEAALPVLRKVPLTLPVEQIAAGDDASCAIDNTQALWCWGSNSVGSVGDGTWVSRPLPVRIGTEPWRSISTNPCPIGVQENGSLWSWGTFAPPAETGQTHAWSTASCAWGVSALDTAGGISNWLHTDDPQPLEGRWKQFAASSTHLCAINEDGSLWCMGYNSYGELGAGTTDELIGIQPVSAPSSWAAIAVGESRTCGIQTDGTLLCWGMDLLDPFTNILVPTPVAGTEAFHWQAVTIGAQHMCALREDATIWCWGANTTQQLGTRDMPTGSSIPVQVGQGTDWTAVSAASAHTCALRSDGSVWCWGVNDWDQLGDGSKALSEPVQIVMPVE